LRSNFDYMRKVTADKLNNPRLLKIHFHTARFWKGTMDYHQLKDVKEAQTFTYKLARPCSYKIPTNGYAK
jgi:hypothetical protein